MLGVLDAMLGAVADGAEFFVPVHDASRRNAVTNRARMNERMGNSLPGSANVSGPIRQCLPRRLVTREWPSGTIRSPKRRLEVLRSLSVEDFGAILVVT